MSKSFASVQNIYEGAVVKKFECIGPQTTCVKLSVIGHYQKRVGSRLRKLKNVRKFLAKKEKVRKIRRKILLMGR